MTSWTKLESRLRKGQDAAVKAVRRYLQNPYEGYSMLASMPTGSGKSGVIAVVLQRASINRALVISPRRAVCDQLIRDISGDFFRRRLGGLPKSLKPVYSLGDDWSNAGIYVATFHKLTALSGAELQALVESFDVVVVDEGHSEPSPIWSTVARSFGKHKILFTATPYRNDLFQFDIHPDHNFIYTFKQARADKVVVTPAFASIREDALLSEIRARIQAAPEIKCIVKCKTKSEVVRFHQKFRAAGIKTLAIHDTFGADISSGMVLKVPVEIEKSDYQVLVHQRKLDEGVDIPSAKILALTYGVASGREVVQTIGRIVRVFNGITPVVLDLSGGANEGLWDSYIAFDESLTKKGAWERFIRSLDMPRMLDAYMAEFPEWSYYGRMHRLRFDFTGFDPLKDLVIPTVSVCFVQVEGGFSLSRFMDLVYWRKHKNGDLARVISSQAGFEVLISVSFESSPLLRNRLFFQPKLSVVVAKVVDGVLAIYDSDGASYSDDRELGTLSVVSSRALLQMTTRSDVVVTKQATANAVGTTARRAERFSMAGGNLEKVHVGQSSSSYALSTATVVNYERTMERHSAYYLGVSSGRVSDQKCRDLSIEQFGVWVSDVVRTLSGKKKVRSEILTSFARPTNEVPRGAPSSLVLDFTGLLSELEVEQGGELTKIPAEFVFLESSRGTFAYGALKLRCEFDATSKSLRLFTMSAAVVASSGEDFNRVLENVRFKALYPGAISYYDGRFYRVTLPSEKGLSIEDVKLGAALVGVTELLQAGLTEKGRTNAARQYVNTTRVAFDSRSIFALLDRIAEPVSSADSTGLALMKNQIIGCDLIACTDMGTESADFVLCSPTKLCYVHIKCGKSAVNPQASAGGIAEVGAQAVKNLENLVSKDPALLPGNLATLRQKWPNDAAAYALDYRVRKIYGKSVLQAMRDHGLRTSAELWNAAWEVISSRRSSDAVEKELWLVVGNAFSRQRFVDEMAKGMRAAGESLQAYQLLDSWLATAQDMDVGLRVFVSP